MTADRIDHEFEAERAFWQARLANLEMLLCELLTKNERLRLDKDKPKPMQSGLGNALTIS